MFDFRYFYCILIRFRWVLSIKLELWNQKHDALNSKNHSGKDESLACLFIALIGKMVYLKEAPATQKSYLYGDCLCLVLLHSLLTNCTVLIWMS